MGWLSHDGVAVPCQGDYCTEQRNRRFAELAVSHMPARYRKVRFAHCTLHPRMTAAQKQTYRDAKTMCEALARGEGNVALIVFNGSVGSGKTQLAACVVNHRIDDPGLGHPGLFVSVPDLLNDIRDGYADDSASLRLMGYREVPLLVLDDLGVEKHTEKGAELLYQVINHRYAQEMPTLITTNVFDQLDERLRSRLMDHAHGCRVVDFAGFPDYRTGK